MAGAHIIYIIISKLSYQQESSLIVGLKINKNLEINFYYTVLPIYLAISLKIEDNWEPLLNNKKVAD